MNYGLRYYIQSGFFAKGSDRLKVAGPLTKTQEFGRKAKDDTRTHRKDIYK